MGLTCPSMQEKVGSAAKMRLEVKEDLSRTCRLDRFCVMCLRAFCSHCCHRHPVYGFHVIIPVDVDAAGHPTFPTHYPESRDPIQDFIVHIIATAADYATPLRRDAYCLNCMAAFNTAACHHHLRECGADFVIRIEERDGRPCVRCRGDEKWFADLESILGDPVGEDDDGEVMLLPLLRRKQGTCVQCGGPVPPPLWARCSSACAASHDRELAQRRERRDAGRAARQLAKLHINESN